MKCDIAEYVGYDTKWSWTFLFQTDTTISDTWDLSSLLEHGTTQFETQEGNMQLFQFMEKISPAVFNKDVSLGKKKGWRRVSYDYRHEEFYWLMMIIAMKSAACFGEAQVRGACQSIKSVFITAFVIQIIILKKKSSKKSLFSFIADKCWKFNVNVYRSSNT